LIEAALEAARGAYAKARAEGDRDHLASAGRDLRYWNARRATAQIRASEPNADIVQFGHTITIERDDSRRQTFRIVGEDEADPAKCSISYVSPLARSLLGRRAGDVVRAGREAAEIVEIK
jgi:transcription elongation GreA/GreB family factor